MDAAILIAFITPALFHLGARATLTAPIHRRYSPALARFMNCAACAGGWYGILAAAVFLVAGWSVFGSTSPLMIPITGLAAITWTPIAVDLQEAALVRLSAPPAPDYTPLRESLHELATTIRTLGDKTDGQLRTMLANVADDADDLADKI